jgi:hypothetical protein
LHGTPFVLSRPARPDGAAGRDARRHPDTAILILAALVIVVAISKETLS